MTNVARGLVAAGFLAVSVSAWLVWLPAGLFTAGALSVVYGLFFVDVEGGR